MLATACLMAAMFFEARNQPRASQIAVQSVVLNRSLKSHKSVCGVLKKHKQFTWAKGGKIPPVRPVGRLDKQAYKVLRKHLYKRNLSRKYLYFNTVRMGRRYKTPVPVVRIANMLFY